MRPKTLKTTPFSFLPSLAFCFLTLTGSASPNVQETEGEFLTTGDFNGDGKTDIAVVARRDGCVRYGFGTNDGNFQWIPGRWAGIKEVTGVAVGKFAHVKNDSLAFASSDENLITILGDVGGGVPTHPVWITNNSIGPRLIFTTGNSNAGKGVFDDLLAFSIYNDDPTPNRVTLLRNAGERFTPISEKPTIIAGLRGKRLALKPGGKNYAAAIVEDAQSARLVVTSMDIEGMNTVLEIPSLSKDSDYLVGNFRGEALCEFIFYVSGQPTVEVCPILESNGNFQTGEMKLFTLSKPITRLLSVDGTKKSQLLAIHGESNDAEILDFDTTNAPVSVQKLLGIRKRFVFDAITLPGEIILLSREFSPTNQFAIRRYTDSRFYQIFQLSPNGSFTMTSEGLLPEPGLDYPMVFRIHDRVVGSQKEKTEEDMKSYTNTIPGTELSYQMSAIPGGEFVMGSPPTENKRADDEGPQHRVKISPFWMGQHEVTWKEFQMFVYQYDEQKMRAKYPTSDEVNQVSDAVTRPSKPYIDMSSGMGMKKGQPAIAMTQHAANKYCQWLSAKTGHFYRLPTEAEWEYAARAGTTKAYFFGNDLTDLSKYAWYYGLQDTDSAYHKIGQKLPNPWGLYDISGNVAEWVLDQYDESFYKMCADGGVVTDPWNKAVRPYPHSVRGGSFDDNPDKLRSAARFKSTPMWKESYPDLPKTIWWLTDHPRVGFRIVRPLKIPSAEEMASYWNNGVEKE